jgi:hypothetical protein
MESSALGIAPVRAKRRPRSGSWFVSSPPRSARKLVGCPHRAKEPLLAALLLIGHAPHLAQRGLRGPKAATPFLQDPKGHHAVEANPGLFGCGERALDVDHLAGLPCEVSNRHQAQRVPLVLGEMIQTELLLRTHLQRLAVSRRLRRASNAVMERLARNKRDSILALETAKAAAS